MMPVSTLSLAMADDTPEAHRTIVCRPWSQDVIVYDLSACQDLNTAPETISRGGVYCTHWQQSGQGADFYNTPHSDCYWTEQLCTKGKQ